MNAHPIHRIPWLILLSALVIYLGAFGAGNAFGLMQSGSEISDNFDFNDDDGLDVNHSSRIPGVVSVNINTSYDQSVLIERTLTSFHVFSAHPPTGPPASVSESFV